MLPDIPDIEFFLKFVFLKISSKIIYQNVKGEIEICYCKYVNFRENFIFAKSVKRHICNVKNLQLGHDLPLSVNDILISPFHKDFIFTKHGLCEDSQKLNLAKKNPNL